MTTRTSKIMFIVFSLLQVICLIGVILCENAVVDYSIIGFQAVALITQITIYAVDARKRSKANKYKNKL